MSDGLRRIRVGNPETDYYYHDCKRIVGVLKARGYYATIEQAKQIWEAFSESMAACWMMLPDDDDDLFSTVSSYFNEVEDEVEDEE